jgi:hypothetical protein
VALTDVSEFLYKGSDFCAADEYGIIWMGADLKIQRGIAKPLL